jgi:hypothetical protein
MALLPHSYFRFLSLRDEPAWEKLRQTLCQSRLHTSRVRDFNDPFEASPVIIGGANETIEVNFKSSGNTVWASLILPLFKTLEGQERTIAEILNHLKNSLSVVSFSRRVNSGLLWGHYTSGYRGIALHFVPTNANNSPFKDSNFHWVTYEKQRPYLSFERLKYYFNQTLQHPAGAFGPQVMGAVELQLMSALLTWKSDDWSYEQEARLIVSSDTLSVQYPSEELVSVILGPNCSSEDEGRISALITQATSPIKLAKARLSRTDYSLEIEW